MEKETKESKNEKDWFLPASILISAIIIAGAWVYTSGLKVSNAPQKTATSANTEKVLPSEGVVLPVRWGDLGAKMISAGVIDGEKFEQLYASPVRNGISNGASRGGLDDETRNLLYGESNSNLKITSENSGIILNLLWALGLGTKNDILERGEMSNSQYGGAGNFASTGGWTLAKGDAMNPVRSKTPEASADALAHRTSNGMNHYSRHPFVILTPEQQKLVERASRNIYRPCCNNPTHFPDCNHGMAMLGLLELMASQGVSEQEMYKVALQVNAYWFPDTYLTIAQYLASKRIDWNDADPKEILSANYSSSSGYRQILSQVAAPAQKSNGGCGV